MIGIAVAYIFFSAVGSEIMKFTPQGGVPIVYIKGSKKSQASPNESDVEKEAAVSPSENSLVSGPALTWRNLTVDIGEKHILKGISGYVRPGDFIALCGASGAGKTTLLTALSQTNFAGELGGEVMFGATRLGKAFKKATGTYIGHPNFRIANCNRICATNGHS